MKKLDELQFEIQKARREMEDVGETELLTAAKTVFENNPDLGMIYWYQYTPSFNDGDPCVNRMCDPWALSKEGLSRHEEEMGGPPHNYKVEEYAWYEGCPREVSKLLDEIYDKGDVWRQIWGTNVQIRLTPEEIEVDEYYEY